MVYSTGCLYCLSSCYPDMSGEKFSLRDELRDMSIFSLLIDLLRSGSSSHVVRNSHECFLRGIPENSSLSGSSDREFG